MRDVIISDDEFRCETRHNISEDARIPVRIGWSDDGRVQSEHGEVLDISQSGARISVRQPLPTDKPLGIRVDVEGLDLKLDIPAEVRWSTIRNSEQWWVGCVFQNEIELQVLTQLASAGYLERRQENRQAVSLESEVRWELTPGSVSVRLRNVSMGGFGFVAQADAAPGDRLLLELKTPDGSLLRIPAKIQWLAPAGTEKERVFGCQFLNKTSYGKLREFLELPLNETKPQVACRPFGLRPLLLIGLLGVLLWISLRNWLN